jgi:hypothetical protein
MALSQLWSVHDPRAKPMPSSGPVPGMRHSPDERQASRLPQHMLTSASGSHGTSLDLLPLGK